MKLPHEDFGDNQPVLYDFFYNRACILYRYYQMTKGMKSSAAKGFNREVFISNYLSDILPPSFHIGKGEIWDSDHSQTQEHDIIIHGGNTSAIPMGGSNVFLFESIFAIIEVKSRIISTKQLSRTIEQFHLLNAMRKESIENGIANPEYPYPFFIIFAYDGMTQKTIDEFLSKSELAGYVDIISILNRGIFISTKFLKSNEHLKEPYVFKRYCASSLGWLFYFLVHYGTKRLNMNIDYLQYFQPTEAWWKGW